MPAWASKACKHILQWHTFSENLLLLLKENCWFLAFHAGSGDALHAMKAAGFFLATSTLLWTEALMPFFFFSSCTTWLGSCGRCLRVQVVVLVCPLVVCTSVCVCACVCVVVHLSDVVMALNIGRGTPPTHSPSPHPLLPPHLYISTTSFVAS